jgi:4-amino-4-deoxy-L-arabinose transferase-like glycosyltransferase
MAAAPSAELAARGSIRFGIRDRLDARWMLGLGGLALATRLALVVSVPDRAWTPDSFFYHLVASNLADGHGYVWGATATASWPPVYPSLVSLVYLVFGHHPQAAYVLNAFIGAATVMLLYWVARRALGGREAIFSAAFLALLPSQIIFSDILLPETLATFEVVAFLALVLALPDRRRSWIFFGAAAAIATLTRAEGGLLLVVPIAIAWRTLPHREAALRAGIAIAVTIVCIAPWTIRNALAMDAFVPLSTNGGQTLWSAHNPKANGGPIRTDPLFDAALAKRYPDRRRYDVERDHILRTDAIEWARGHPGWELAQIPGRAAHLVGPASPVVDDWLDPPLNHAVIGPNARFRLGMAADIGWFGLLTLSVLSMLTLGRAAWRNRLLFGAGVYLATMTLFYCLIFFGSYRYRTPLEPLLILIAAPLVARLARVARAPDLG